MRLATASRSARRLLLVAAAMACTAAAVAGVAAEGDAAAPHDRAAFTRVGDPRHLPNAHRIDDKLVSGAQPEGEDGFKQLAEMGVKTIISVDGAKPDVAAARRHGLRYVHLPIGYDDVTADEGRQIAKAIEELPGPIYLHCHHGRHRSAAALAVACVVSGRLKPEQADSVLRTFGTGENYKGLWASARDARPLAKDVLSELKIDFVETAKVPPMADAMVAIDETMERLKQAAKAGWRAPADHPDLDPPHEALQLREKLHELGRTKAAREDHPEDFRRLMTENEATAQELEDALRAWGAKRGAAGATDLKAPTGIDAAMKAVSAGCTACHKAHRD